MPQESSPVHLLRWDPTSARDLSPFFGDLKRPLVAEEEGSSGSDEETSTAESTDLPLAQAARRGDFAEVDRLLQEGAEVDESDGQGQTALFKAVAAGNVPVMARLLLAGADPTARAHSGKTALEVTSDRRYVALMRGLAPPKAGLVADAWQLEEALELMPEDLQEAVLDATESETRKLAI
mmetsp:Transcript_47039/g.150193  ORF Transcript_47039/g.150193 Transcript_47039/m.150193 type:complete len:180 (-) Transcript_47039:85-624(-)